MITVKSLTWSNWFSYGEDNYLNLEDAPLIQIAGKNGSGKSSIPLIIEEILYGKNHIGKKKQTLVNRYLKNPILTAKIEFSKDKVDYKIVLTRKSTIKIQFFKGNEDISSHTSTNTYKSIQEVLGIDFKIFVQLIYQSSKMNLEFLEATDTNRKRFLIGLFKLDRYLEVHNVFKKLDSDVNTEVAVLRGKLSTIESWIHKHSNEDLITKEAKELPSINKSDIDKLTSYKAEVLNIKSTNTKINKNNQYKELLSNIDLSALSSTEIIPEDKSAKEEEKRLAQHKLTENTTRIRTYKGSVDKIKKLSDKCPTCYQDIQETIKNKLIDERENRIEELEVLNESINTSIKVIETTLKEYRLIARRVSERDKLSDEFSKLQIMIDNDIPSNIIIESDISNNIKKLENTISEVTIKIKEISNYNIFVESRNSKIKVILEQLEGYASQAEDIREKLYDIEEQQGKIGILKKAFSTSGLVNYKLDYLIKDLELQINSYLQELSSGKFQIVFILQDEKLNIEILDEGVAVGIEEVSAGELAKINTSTLLAIRKLMSAISSTKLNILFLDEVMGVLDDEGKEKLIEVLLNEKDLNTFLVSHEYSHPLIPKINIVKEAGISRIDHG